MNRRIIFTLIIAITSLSLQMPAYAAPRKKGNFRKLHIKPTKSKRDKKDHINPYDKFSNEDTALNYLKNKNIDPSQYDTELINRLLAGDCETTAALVCAGARLNYNGDEKKPFILAAEFCNVDVLRLMVNKGVDIRCLDFQPRPGVMGMGMTAQFSAAKANKLDNLKYLESLGLSCTDRSRDDYQSISVLSIAAQHGSYECARYAIEHGADPYEKHRSGATIMYRAAQSGNMQLIKYLDSLGVDMHAVATGYGMNVLCMAAHSKNNEAIRYFLNRGVNPNEDLQRGGLRPTHLIVSCADEETVRLLIEKKADFHAKNNQGKTPLDYARGYGNSAVMKLLGN